jgi:hypothetical protein
MNSILCKLAQAWLSHYRQPSSWAGATVAVGTALHYSVPPELQGIIDGLAAGVISLLLWFIQERRTLPPGTVPVVTDSVQSPKAGTTVIIDSPPGSTVVQTGRSAPVRTNPEPPSGPVRPGFGPYL